MASGSKNAVAIKSSRKGATPSAGMPVGASPAGPLATSSPTSARFPVVRSPQAERLDALLEEILEPAELEFVHLGRAAPEDLATRLKLLRAVQMAHGAISATAPFIKEGDAEKAEAFLKRGVNLAEFYMNSQFSISRWGASPWPAQKVAEHISRGLGLQLDKARASAETDGLELALPATMVELQVAEKALDYIMDWLTGDVPATRELRVKLSPDFEGSAAQARATHEIKMALRGKELKGTTLADKIVRAALKALGHPDPRNLFR